MRKTRIQVNDMMTTFYTIMIWEATITEMIRHKGIHQRGPGGNELLIPF